MVHNMQKKGLPGQEAVVDIDVARVLEPMRNPDFLRADLEQLQGVAPEIRSKVDAVFQETGPEVVARAGKPGIEDIYVQQRHDRFVQASLMSPKARALAKLRLKLDQASAAFDADMRKSRAS